MGAAPQAKLTPVELRQQMNELIGYYKRTWGDARTAAGKQIRAALEANRFLFDQVPNTIIDAVFAQ